MRFWEVEASELPPGTIHNGEDKYLEWLRPMAINPAHVSVIEPVMWFIPGQPSTPLDPPCTKIEFYGGPVVARYIARPYHEVKAEHAACLERE